MNDRRPLYLRALAARRAQRRHKHLTLAERALARAYGVRAQRLTDAGFIDSVRAILGLRPMAWRKVQRWNP